MVLSRVVRIEEGLVLQHYAGDGEQSIGDESQRAGMAVATLAESGVFGLADRVELYGDARPMVERIAEAAVCGETSDDDLALSGALGNPPQNAARHQGRPTISRGPHDAARTGPAWARRTIGPSYKRRGSSR